LKSVGLEETGKQRGQENQEKKTSGKTNLNLASLRKIENKLRKFKRGLPYKPAQMNGKKNHK